MPPRPFPYTLRVGNDICNIDRVRKLITGKWSDEVVPSVLDSFIRRILTPPEVRYFWHRFGPEEQVHNKTSVVSRYLAGRFAAKEACRKACPHFVKNTRGFQQIIVLPVTLHDKSQPLRPQALILDASYALLRAPALSLPDVVQGESLGREVSSKNHNDVMDVLEGQLCEISISHDGEYATAVALVPEMQPLLSPAT